MDEIQITPKLLARMRLIYGHECSVCGGRLSLQDSRDMVFACSPYEDDPDENGRLRHKEGRGGADEHYSKSRTYFSRENWNPDRTVMALLNAYEALLKEKT